MADVTKPIETMTPHELAEYDSNLRQRIVTLKIRTRQLEQERDRLRDEAAELSSLFDQQWARTREADAIYNKAHGITNGSMPDLGKLIGWLLAERDRRKVLEDGERWQHVKRGSEYTLIGHARLQTSGELSDMDNMVVYRADDGTLWVRPVSEFYDGRFARAAARALEGSDSEYAKEMK